MLGACPAASALPAQGSQRLLRSPKSSEVPLSGPETDIAGSGESPVANVRGLDNDLHLIFLATPAASVTIEPDVTSA